MSYERDKAFMEAYQNEATDEYFAVRPHIDNNDRRKGFEAGFARGWAEHPAQRTKLTQSEIPEGWQPVETAPKDGTQLLLAGEFDGPGDWRIKMGYWAAYENDWHLFGGSWQPTRWMPLPAAPKEPT